MGTLRNLAADLYCEIFSYVDWNCLARSCLAVGTGWRKLAQVTVKRNKVQAEAWVETGIALIERSNNVAKSILLFRDALERYPRLLPAYYWIAKALFISKQEELGVAMLRKALQQHPNEVERLKLQGCILYAKNNDLEASRVLRRAVKLSPLDPALYFELGFCFHGQQEYESAIAAYTTCIELNYRRVFVAYANRANCYFQFNRVPEALDDLTKSLSICPGYELALATRAFVYLNSNQFDAAYADYTTIIDTSSDPSIVSDAYFNRAFARSDDVLEEDIRAAKEIDPSNPDPPRYFAGVLLNSDRVHEAVDEINSWVDANPNHPDMPRQLAFRAEMHCANADLDAAVADYAAAVSRMEGQRGYTGNHYQQVIVMYKERLAALLVVQREVKNAMHR
eukprot:TRINITY_DN68751_c0_g1_i1.p1 TRINITY_DN68751_c0_g1~~TRINITY_DN68751_c0_g1_i1.p1  ORF type:complete len:395 (+),score=74.15 TRINITY_DN68751_c0_g1_i1:70-1254(+)